MSADITIGKIYAIDSRRKGKFTGRLLSADETWATFEITHGRANAMLPDNVREKGEEVTVRRAWCTFIEVSTSPKEPGK